MKEFQYVITDSRGLHARPAGQLVKESGGYESTVTILAPRGSADSRRLMALMKLAVKQGDQLTVRVEGLDEEIAASRLLEFFRNNL